MTTRNFLFCVAACCCFTPAATSGQDTDQAVSIESKRLAALARSTEQLGNQKYLLAYHFQPSETVYYEVVHQSAVETKVDGNTERVKSRSKSLKKWEFSDSTNDEQLEFTHGIDHVSMWSEMSGRQAIKYDSRTDQEPPADYASVAETLGKPISTVVADRHGKIIDRHDEIKQIDRGTGGLLTPLPPTPVAIGTAWTTPSAVKVQLGDGRFKSIKIQMRYVLEKVATGVATITITTQVLTPVTDARVKSQLVQKLSQGTIKFDIDAGRMISKELHWDETVIGFNGAESNMSFLAQMTERLVSPADLARGNTPAKR